MVRGQSQVGRTREVLGHLYRNMLNYKNVHQESWTLRKGEKTGPLDLVLDLWSIYEILR